MIQVNLETTGRTRIEANADFKKMASSCSDAEEFITNVFVELQTGILGAVAAAQDECLRILGAQGSEPLEEDVVEMVRETLLGAAKQITPELLMEYRESDL